MVLIVAPEDDVHALAVKHELEHLGRDVLVVDAAAVPDATPISFVVPSGCAAPRLKLGGHVLDPVSGVWWRRPTPHRINELITSPDVEHYCRQASRATFLGGLRSVCANVVNPLETWERARLKPFQLACAAECGLTVPETIVSNDPHAVRAFTERVKRTVVKTVAAWDYDLRETRLLEPDDLTRLDSVRFAPDMFQEFVEGTYDLRVTVVGSAVFAAAVAFRNDRSAVDGRFEFAPLTPVELEEELAHRLLRLHAMLGLVYGAYDLRRTAAGDAVFFEVNPEGQFLFVEIQTGQPIARAVASVLAGVPAKQAA
jgi:hypothetical protein